MVLKSEFKQLAIGVRHVEHGKLPKVCVLKTGSSFKNGKV